ncbi:MAG: ADP-ribosylglycohydrolase family protein [Verrucomicrobiota bacterium]
MTDFQKRRAGLLFGSFTADALSLGVHWIYNTDELSQKFGYIDRYYTPGAESYHPKKRAGAQGHVGDQALCLNQYLVRTGTWEATAFMEDWIAIWPNYDDYFDHATKATLANMDKGLSLTELGSNSSELAGPARIAPVMALLADGPQTTAVQAAIEQTTLTHHSPQAIEAAAFLARACYQLLHGADISETLETTAPPWALNKAKAVLNLDPIPAVAKLGLSCPIEKALPAVLYLSLKFQDDLPKAFSENAMAGGDNCARALALGMLLGAANGIDAVPGDWLNQLIAKPELDRLIEK